MAIKAIQLRGISRTPSDRMTADGGLAESLNVYLDEDETAPMPMPEDVTDTDTDGGGKKLFPSAHVNPTDWEAVFIHKSPYFTRAIVKYTEEVQPEEEESEEPALPSSGTSGYEVDEEQDPWEVDDSENWGDSNEPVEGGGSQSQEESGESATGTTASAVTVTKLGWVNDGVVTELMELEAEETFIRGVSLGNTLGIVTDKTVYWFLCKYTTYSELGSNIPFPKFTLAEKRLEGNSSFEYQTPDNQYTSAANAAEIAQQVGADNGFGRFLYAQFVVFAVKLFDGSKLISAPIMVGNPSPPRVSYVEYSSFTDYDVQITESKWLYYFHSPYKIWLKLDEEKEFFTKWADVIDSVEVYLSEQIIPKIKVYYEETVDGENLYEAFNRLYPTYSRTENFYGELDVKVEYDEDYSIKDDLLSKSQFYLAKSYYPSSDDESVKSEFYALFDGIVLDTSEVMTSQNLVTKESLNLAKADMKRYSVSFRQATPYNNQLVAAQISEIVKFSYPCLTATMYDSSEPEYYVKGITFHCIDYGGKWFNVEADINGCYERPNGIDYESKVKINIDGDSKWPIPYGFIICPDVRAKYADISVHKEVASGVAVDTIIRVEMSEHPFLDCSYWYGDINKKIVEFETTSRVREKYPTREIQETYNGSVYAIDLYERGTKSYTDVIPNKIYVSETDSPFTFPLAKRHTFTGKVLGVAIATTALSTGQFGQYPLYVFTDDGIWAMETGAAGDFVTSKPVSRDVCINPESITSIDNAVVFVTEKGVMLISGSQIQCISENMNGRHFHLERSSEEYNLIAGSDWASLLDDITTDDTHFMAFMKEAFITYDYTGARLVFFKPDEKYQYVYYLKTATWHKTYVDCGLADTESGERPRFEYPLSDYPETYVNALCESEQNPGYRILKMSTRKDVTATGRVRGMIVTRPIEFGLADVRKVIKDIRIRGVYEKSDGNGSFYILLGSYDGLHWSVLRSLRGGSYKLFRMIILTNLAPNERISWIDADFEERYNSKLR